MTVALALPVKVVTKVWCSVGSLTPDKAAWSFELRLDQVGEHDSIFSTEMSLTRFRYRNPKPVVFPCARRNRYRCAHRSPIVIIRKPTWQLLFALRPFEANSHVPPIPRIVELANSQESLFVPMFRGASGRDCSTAILRLAGPDSPATGFVQRTGKPSKNDRRFGSERI